MHKYKKHIRELGRKKHAAPPEKVIAELLLRRYSEPGSYLIVIGGPGGTGKSSFSRALAGLLNNAPILHLDDYKTPRETRKGKNVFGAHPDANYMELVAEHLQAAKNGQSFDKPVYNAVTGEADSTEPFTPAKFNVIDGEISTYRQFRDLVDFSIFIDSDWKTQLQTRLTRDIEERKYTHEKAIATFLQSNLREFAAYGAESKNWADVNLYCHDNYELSIESVSEELYDNFKELLEADYNPVELAGPVTPVYTPFTRDDYIDREALIRHLEYLAANGVERIHVGSIHGEVFSLTPEERIQLLLLAKRYFPGIVIFDISSENYSTALRLAEKAELVGADAVTVMPACLLRLERLIDLKRCLERLAEVAEVPLIIDGRFAAELPAAASGYTVWRESDSVIDVFGADESCWYDIPRLKYELAEKIEYPCRVRLPLDEFAPTD